MKRKKRNARGKVPEVKAQLRCRLAFIFPVLFSMSCSLSPLPESTAFTFLFHSRNPFSPYDHASPLSFSHPFLEECGFCPCLWSQTPKHEKGIPSLFFSSHYVRRGFLFFVFVLCCFFIIIFAHSSVFSNVRFVEETCPLAVPDRIPFPSEIFGAEVTFVLLVWFFDIVFVLLPFSPVVCRHSSLP